MAWGYERSFTIEHDNTLRKRINCKDCIYYESSDKSCLKRPLYLPVDGYNSWRNGKYFALTKGVSNYKEKKEQYFNKEETRDIVSREKNTRWVRFVCGREISKRQEY